MGNRQLDPEAQGVLNAFLQRYLDDQDEGKLGSVEDYQALFPGYEEAVGRKYEELVGGSKTNETDASSTSTRAADDSEVSSVDAQASLRETGTETPLSSGGGDEARLGSSASSEGLVGQTVGPFHLQRKLGAGGMGDVYLAEQVRPIRRLVALKCIKLGMDTQEIVARFEAERQALAVMDHPAIAKVYDAGETIDGLPYFAMEYVEGERITEFSDRHSLTVVDRLILFRRLLDGIQHAHQKGIIHRDLKPSNILVAGDADRPEPKIIDFGIAKSLAQPLTDDAFLTQTGQVVGTPVYMSPEQIGLAPSDIDTRSDIYALGVVLYELLTGILPFDPSELLSGSFVDIQRRILEETPPRPSVRALRSKSLDELATRRSVRSHVLARTLRGDLDWITMKALEKDPNRRYSSASEFAADIDRYLQHEPVLAGPPSLTYRCRKFVRKHRVGVSVAALVALLLAGFAVWSVHQEDRRRLATIRERYDSGLDNLRQLDDARQRLNQAKRDRDEASSRLESWRPVWQRNDELRLERKIKDVERELGAKLRAAVSNFWSSYEMAAPDSAEAQLAAGELRKLSRLSNADLGLDLQEDFLRIFLEQDRFVAESAENEKVELKLGSDPPGAEIYCFRYQPCEGRLLPLPYRPEQDPDGLPAPEDRAWLEIERVWSPQAGPLAEGDRLLTVHGREVRLQGDLVAALEGVEAETAVPVTVVRDGHEVAFEWVPFPTDDGCERGDCVVDFRKQFGFTVAGYPLEFGEASLLGREAMTVALAPGSYLFVFRRDGYADARMPVRVPLLPHQERDFENVQLARRDDVPPGYVHVPAGVFRGGDDAKVDAALSKGEQHVPDYYISRFEVTVEEYLTFLNHPLYRDRINEEGVAPPRSPKLIADFAARPQRELRFVRLIPRNYPGGQPLFSKTAEGWAPIEILKPKWPVLAVTIDAAEEYAYWLSEQSSGRWIFELPSDLEWEKAARGADRRAYVWGNYPIWSFSRSKKGQTKNLQERGPGEIGAYPMDESVYGVRDMAGLMSEPTRDNKEGNLRALRGGSWYTVTDYFFRVTNRNGKLPWNQQAIDMGFRLVARRAQE